MRFTEIQEGAYERASDKKVRISKLHNERAALREKLRHAQEEQDSTKIDEIHTKLGRLDDAIATLSESVAPTHEIKAKLKQLKAEYSDMPKQPGNQEGYDALDDMRYEIKKLEDQLSALTENADADVAYESHRKRAMEALAALEVQISTFTRAQKRNVSDWGYVGTMGSLATRLEELTEYFGN